MGAPHYTDYPKMNLTLKWSLEAELKSKEEQSRILDEEVETFSQWLTNLPDSRAAGALSSPERALIKTYLVQKLTGKLGGD